MFRLIPLDQNMKRILDKRVLQGIIILISSVILLKLFLTNFFFRLEEIEIQGRVSLSADQILQPFEAYWNQNIFALPLSKIEAVYNAQFALQSIHFKRVLPGKVIVKIEEDLPVLMVYVDNKFYEISASGKVLSNQTQLKGAPILTNVEHIFQEHNILNEKIANALRVLVQLRRVMPAFYDEIAEMQIYENDIHLNIPNFQKKVIFSLDNFDNNLYEFKKVFSQVQNEQLSIIDLRFDKQMILRKGTAQ